MDASEIVSSKTQPTSKSPGVAEVIPDLGHIDTGQPKPRAGQGPRSDPAAEIRPKPPAGQGAGYDIREEIIPPRHLRLVTGLPPVSVWRLRKRGLFPQPIRLSAGRIGWRRADIEAWIEERRQTK